MNTDSCAEDNERSPRITFLSGGTGTPKLIRGFRKVIPDENISVIVNTAEDMWIYGSHLSPDIDTLMYLFAGILNTDTWWGIRGDTTITHDRMKELGEDLFLTLGDKDRAVNIIRARLLKSGMTLTKATEELCARLNVKADIMPMTDSTVTTNILTKNGLIHFQEYWVRYRGTVPIEKVVRTFREGILETDSEEKMGEEKADKKPSIIPADVSPRATAKALNAIKSADIVILGPSNPVTSISPILECEGIKEALKKKYVVAVSPFIGDAPISGPAKALMEAWGMPPTSKGTYGLYKDFTDLFVQDERDTEIVENALRCDTLMINEEISVKLARTIMERIKGKY
ncbi:MAG: 2-phospho-L-lactate transferase [Methanomicrobium sp.]|nr:2-phospho-L-lactate transferase [Methanomicrobium sp.]